MAEVISIISAAIAAIAAVLAWRANRISGRSATASEASALEAKRSADAAEESNLIAREARAQALERSDVEWEAEIVADTLIYRNRGSTTAFAVRAVVRVNDERFDIDGGDVASDETFACDTKHVIAAARQKARDTTDSFRGSGITFIASTKTNVEARISWESESGVPQVAVVDKHKWRK